MPHTIKIDDKTYDKLKAYCDLNNVSPHDIARSAIEVYLNDLMYGDAPFMKKAEPESQQKHAENLDDIGLASVEAINHDEQGNLEIHMKKLDGVDSVQAKYTVHNDGTVEIDKGDKEEKKPQRPTKRRL